MSERFEDIVHGMDIPDQPDERMSLADVRERLLNGLADQLIALEDLEMHLKSTDNNLNIDNSAALYAYLDDCLLKDFAQDPDLSFGDHIILGNARQTETPKQPSITPFLLVNEADNNLSGAITMHKLDPRHELHGTLDALTYVTIPSANDLAGVLNNTVDQASIIPNHFGIAFVLKDAFLLSSTGEVDYIHPDFAILTPLNYADMPLSKVAS